MPAADAQPRAQPIPGAWSRSLRWRDAHPVLSLYAVALATRVVVLVAATLGGLLIPQYGWDRAWTPDAPVPLRFLARWDSGFYLQVADHGRLDRPELWAFSPGFPMAIRGLRALVPPLDGLSAAFVIGTLALLAAVPLSYHLAARWFDRGTAWRATALLTLLPGSFYFTAVYADGLFTALLLGFLLALARRHWVLAGCLASLAALTRPQGLVLPGILLLGLLLERARSGRWPTSGLLALPLALALPLLDATLAYQTTGDALYPHHARSTTWPQVAWRMPGRLIDWPLDPLQRILVHAGFIILLLTMLWALRDAWRRRLDAPLEIHALTLGLGFVCFTYSDPAATLRYLLPIVGVTWMLGAWTRTPLRFALVAIPALATLATIAALFATWYPYY